MLLREMNPSLRPRERLVRQGVDALSDAELLAIILQKGDRTADVMQLSNQILNQKPLPVLAQCTVSELVQLRGIGIAQACKIKAIFACARRASYKPGGKMSSALTVAVYSQPFLGHLEHEQVMVLILDTKHKLLVRHMVSKGSLNAVLVHPREVFKIAIRTNAHAIIVVHNHPSGDCTPSEEDITITKQLSKAGEILGIKLLDHVIVSNAIINEDLENRDTYYSFHEAGFL